MSYNFYNNFNLLKHLSLTLLVLSSSNSQVQVLGRIAQYNYLATYLNLENRVSDSNFLPLFRLTYPRTNFDLVVDSKHYFSQNKHYAFNFCYFAPVQLEPISVDFSNFACCNRSTFWLNHQLKKYLLQCYQFMNYFQKSFRFTYHY